MGYLYKKAHLFYI